MKTNRILFTLEEYKSGKYKVVTRFLERWDFLGGTLTSLYTMTVLMTDINASVVFMMSVYLMKAMRIFIHV